MNWTLKINEAGNAALVVMLIFGGAYLVDFLYRRWQAGDDLYTNYTNKAALGILTVFMGFMIKSAAAWWSLHIINTTNTPINNTTVMVAFIVGTLMGLWGVICTVRALAPYEWRRWTWWWMIGGLIAFGSIFVL